MALFPPPVSASDPDRIQHLVRRNQAREHLSSSLLRGRGAHKPTGIIRSLTDISFSHPKNVDALVEQKTHFFRGLGAEEELGAQEKLKKLRKGSQQQTRHQIVPSLTTTPTTLTPSGDKDNSLTQQLTLSELRRLLGSKGVDKLESSKQNMPKYKGMTIQIQRAPQMYPNISLTFEKTAFKDSSLPTVKHKESKKVREKSLPKVMALPIIPPRLSHAEQPSERIENLAVLLKSIDHRRGSSKDWTKKWINENPLGPEVNEEFQEDDVTPERPEEIPDHPVKPSRKVRFGTEEFLYEKPKEITYFK